MIDNYTERFPSDIKASIFIIIVLKNKLENKLFFRRSLITIKRYYLMSIVIKNRLPEVEIIISLETAIEVVCYILTRYCSLFC